MNYYSALFPQAAQSFIEWEMPLPHDYNGGTVTAKFYWLTTSASTNSVVWGLQAVSFPDNTAINTAFGTAQEVTDANNAANTVNQSASTAAITIAGTPAADVYCQFRAYRKGSGSDNLGANALLLCVQVQYTRA